MNGRLAAIGSLCALVAACGEPAPAPGSPLGQPVWTETSSSLDLSCFQYWQGSMRFVATRDQLSAAQLGMLAAMRSIDAVPGCVSDVMGCSLSVVQADASTTTIDAIETDSACDRPRKVVSFDTFSPFLGSLGCQYAQVLSSGRAAPVPADARCFNGLFTTTNGATIVLTLQVDDPATVHHIELDACAQVERFGKLFFTVLDSDGTTVLGTSNPPGDAGSNGTCAVLDQTFPRSGLFGLQVVAPPGVLPGDFYLRFY
jgi:hypothetical protein